MTLAKFLDECYMFCGLCILMEPGYQYFEDKFRNDLKSALSAFKCLRYFDPAKINELQPSAGDLDDLQVLLFFSSVIIADLKKELSTYLAAANGTSVQWMQTSWNGGRITRSATILVYWLSGHSFTSTFFCSC